VTRILIIFAVLGFAAADAHGEPAWWQQFYVRTGIRTSLGLERTTMPSFGLGYRAERGRWAIDVEAFDVQQGLDEGVHEVGYVAVVRSQPVPHGTAWLSLGAGYSIARGWLETDLPLRRGHGAQLGLAVGYDLATTSTVRWFGQLGVGIPLYDLRDTYESMDSSVRIVPVDVAVGARF
jgi:hypothetical protein